MLRKKPKGFFSKWQYLTLICIVIKAKLIPSVGIFSVQIRKAENC
jgi:hypothetical protein